jgi:hypothetical protein
MGFCAKVFHYGIWIPFPIFSFHMCLTPVIRVHNCIIAEQ